MRRNSLIRETKEDKSEKKMNKMNANWSVNQTKVKE